MPVQLSCSNCVCHLTLLVFAQEDTVECCLNHSTSILCRQQLLQLLQPRQVQVKSAPLADIKRIYDISGRYIPIEEYRSPFGLPSLGRPPQQTRPMGFKQGGLVSQNTDNMFDHKEVGTVNDLLRILRDKR